MPLSQFNALLTGYGKEPVQLQKEYLLITDVQGICDVDFSKESVNLNHDTYTWGGSSMAYPDFARRVMMYFVIPDAFCASASDDGSCWNCFRKSL